MSGFVRMLAVALGLGVFLLGGCAPLKAPMAPGCGGGEGLVPWRSLASGVWVWEGGRGDIDARNRGHVAPTTLVVDGGEAAVIDPGPSFLHGERVRRSVACRFQARVRWVVNTHAHAENVLANSAFARTDATTIASGPATLAAMRERCPACLASLTLRAGEAAMAGTEIVLPSVMLRAGDVLPVGRLRLQVLPFEQGHTEGDLVLWNAETRVLWAGGLAYLGRVPELSQGSVDGWLAALDHLDALAPTHLVAAAVSSAPGEGGLPEALRATRAYLRALRQGVLQAMDEGHQPQEAGLVPLPGFAGWAGYRERHLFNVQRAWRELEPVWMDRAR
jgi:glyoxylase-like metal-dependent hydrolase (beta-lactamase superfamily II)